MKRMNFSIKTLIILSIFISVFACKKDNIKLYEQEAAVYFKDSSAQYTFTENQENIELGLDTINIPVLISGSAANYDRYFEVAVMKDDARHTASDDMYTIGKGIVKANKYAGNLAIIVNYVKEYDDSIYNTVIKIKSNDEFQVSNLKNKNFAVKFGNILTKPENWDSKLKRYFGEYSNSWYSFILKTTGLNSIPYYYTSGSEQSGITPEEAAKWPMSLPEMKVYAFLTRDALIEYNNNHPDDEMKHKDGKFINTKVVMGVF